MDSWVRDYIGIPFANKGRGEACDCWGLVRRVYQERYKIKLPAFVDGYDSALEMKGVCAILAQEKENRVWLKIEKGQEKFNDMIILNIGGSPVHIGFVLEHGRMLHIEKGIDSCIESYKSLRWKNRVEGFYRHKELGCLTMTL